MSKITIVGAGLSGMVAAINLAKQGYEVTVIEKEKQIGGSPAFHPSLHATPIDVRLTSDFVGIDLSSSFALLAEFHTWMQDKRVNTRLNNYGVERGPRDTSIDIHLYKLCKELGVKFDFGQTVQKFSDIPPGSIIATGIMRTMDDLQDAKTIHGHGYGFLTDCKIGPASWQFKDTYSPDYFYAVAMNGILYGLIFARLEKIDKKSLDVVNKQFVDRHGIEIKEWKPFFCETIMDNRLFFGPGNKYIMTGSASGTYDPYFGFGIVGALTSGKISALAVRDPEGAQILFDRVNRNHDFLFKLFEILDRLPLLLKLKLFKMLPNHFKLVKPVFGRVGHGIPGYPRNWISEFTGNEENYI